MVFTTTLFTYFFFPIAVALWLLGKFIDKRIKTRGGADVVLIVISIIFFGWNNIKIIWWLIIFIGSVYVLGLLIEQANINGNKKITRIALMAGVGILLILLGYYKYSAFSIQILNQIFKSNIVVQNIVTPLGISFITFTAISYLADIYNEKANAGSLLDCALYISFFPKLISGPIVLWRDFSLQVRARTIQIERVYEGIRRITYGFVKKLILADTFGSIFEYCADILYI